MSLRLIANNLVEKLTAYIRESREKLGIGGGFFSSVNRLQGEFSNKQLIEDKIKIAEKLLKAAGKVTRTITDSSSSSCQQDTAIDLHNALVIALNESKKAVLRHNQEHAGHLDEIINETLTQLKTEKRLLDKAVSNETCFLTCRIL